MYEILRCVQATVAALVAVLTIGVVGSPTSAEVPVPNDPGLATCPVMTDSVVRLYSAYFLRLPDTGGFNYWLDIYSGPSGGLGTISNVFAASDEFVNTYGALTNEQFVTLVYNNVMDRAPDAGGLAHWTNALNNGFGRGEVMISFGESQEYVDRTGTVAPLAGYLSWYDDKVEFECGTGSNTVALSHLPPSPHFDILVVNVSNDFIDVSVTGRGAGRVDSDTSELRPDYYTVYWNVRFDMVPTSIEFFTPIHDSALNWTMVSYDQPHSETRSPYTD